MPARARSVFAALLIAGATMLHASRVFTLAPQAPNDASPAERFERWLDAQAAQALADGARAREAASTADAVRRRAGEIRRQVLDAMGGLPDVRTPLNARITGRLDRDGYRIEHLVFESLPGFFVTANLYVPTPAVGRLPAVLGTAGHSDVGKAAPLYQHVWAGLARRGIVVLAYDPPGQGERLEYVDARTGESRVGSGTREHDRAGQQCLLTGTSIARYFAWDGVRALDYLLTRSDVDPARIGVAGNSGGGTQAAWLGVVEPRLSAIDSSCYITSWSALWTGPGPQDMEQVLPGFLARGLDFADLIAAAAPRPYLVSSAVRDYFPIEGARATVARARNAYAALDAAERLAHVENDDQHGWSQPLREAAYRWFGRWWLEGDGGHSRGIHLQADLRSGDDAGTVEPPDVLRATPTGQVSTSFRARTIFDLNSERAHALSRTRPPATPARIRALLQIPDVLPAPQCAGREPQPPRAGLRTERLELESDTGVALPALLVHPRDEPARGSVVVADARGSAADQQAGALEVAVSWAQRGYLALVLDVRGAGVLAPTRGESGYSADYQVAARAWLLGTSVVAWQTRDLLAGLELLERELPGADKERVVHAGGLTAPAALFAAALHRVSAAWIEGGIVSYLDLARTRDYAAAAGLFVPGVLEVTDLPELMALSAPATVHLVRPVRADGAPVRTEAELGSIVGGTVPSHVRLDLLKEE